MIYTSASISHFLALSSVKYRLCSIDPFHFTSRGLACDLFFAELVSKVVPGTTQKFTRAVRSSRMHSDGALDCSQL